MKEHYYNISYIEYENGNLKGNASILVRSTSDLSIDQIKNHIRGHINNPKAVLTIVINEKIDKETYLNLGGDPVAPWFKG